MTTYGKQLEPEERTKAEEEFGIIDQGPEEALSGLEKTEGVEKTEFGDKTKYGLPSGECSTEELRQLADSIGTDYRVTTIESAGAGEEHSLVVYDL